MKCWQANKKNPANKFKNFELDPMKDYGSISDIVGTISTVAAITKQGKKKCNQINEDARNE